MSVTASHIVDWNAVDTVFVDMDGTLLDLAFDNFFWLEVVPAHYAERHGLAPDAARERLTSRFDAAAGTLSWYCLDHWTRELELDIRTLKRSHKHLIRFLPRAPEFLAAVRARRKSIWLVTNAHQDTLRVKAEHTGVDRLVDSVVCSHDLDAPKESRAFWTELSRRRPFDPERTLLIEDSLAVLGAASAFGLRHMLAIRRPDSRLPARDIAAYRAVDGVADLV